MALDHKQAHEVAQGYFRSAKPLARLGWGISGFVYLSPDACTAVKVHRHDESFNRELQVYLRLRSLKISNLHGLVIPKLRDYVSNSKLLRMDFVRAPYLLDFAGATFNPPDYCNDTMENWYAGIAETFGPNAWRAYAVYEALSRHGIYYTDFRLSNLNLAGLAGLEVADKPDRDEF